MQIEVLRREFFKLKTRGFSYAKCKSILRAQFEHEVSIRTLKRWIARLDKGNWDMRDLSRRPKKIHKKITPAIEQEVIHLRQQTGWGEDKLYPHLRHLQISSRTIKRIFSHKGLCRKTTTKGRRVKWIRWQREHPNSLWQIDHTDEQDTFDCYTLSVLDDCSRYSLALVKLKQVTTNIVTKILDDLIKDMANLDKY